MLFMYDSRPAEQRKYLFIIIINDSNNDINYYNIIMIAYNRRSPYYIYECVSRKPKAKLFIVGEERRDPCILNGHLKRARVKKKNLAKTWQINFLDTRRANRPRRYRGIIIILMRTYNNNNMWSHYNNIGGSRGLLRFAYLY